MSQIAVEEFSGHRKSDVPHLFSSTSNFRFHGPRRKLVHRKLPPGPKGYAVVAVASTGHEASFVECNRIALTIPVEGRSEVRVAGRTFVTQPGEMFIIGPSERWSKLIPRGEAGHYRSYTIIAPSRCADILNGENCLHRLDCRMSAQIKDFCEFAFDAFSDVQENSLAKAALIEAVVEDLFLDALKRPTDGCGSERYVHRHERVVRDAQGCMEAHLSEPLSISDIAGGVGVGTRTLQLAFKNRLGVTPRQYLTSLRLERAQEMLLANPWSSVTLVAYECGFAHLGRFGQAYKSRYGETPSETARRRRVRH